jgi:hypothetical protein
MVDYRLTPQISAIYIERTKRQLAGNPIFISIKTYFSNFTAKGLPRICLKSFQINMFSVMLELANDCELNFSSLVSVQNKMFKLHVCPIRL